MARPNCSSTEAERCIHLLDPFRCLEKSPPKWALLFLHVAAVFAAYVVEGVADLAE